MRAHSHIIFCCLCGLLAGCDSQSSRRADYVRATLPYDATIVVTAAATLRQENPNSKALGALDEAVRMDILRLQVCLSDPGVPEKDKKFARTVYEKLVSYAKEHDVAVGYRSGHEYITLPDDIALPHRMVIRDAIDGAIKNRK